MLAAAFLYSSPAFAAPGSAPPIRLATTTTILRNVSNAQMDCDWGFVCHDGHADLTAPVMHFQSQDALHRLSGFAQYSVANHQHIHMALFASLYSPDTSGSLPWNVAAFADFRTALFAMGASDLSNVPPLFPAGAIGNRSAQAVTLHGHVLLAVTCWTGTTEIEAIATYPQALHPGRQLVLDTLAAQSLTALHDLLPVGRPRLP